MDVSDEDTVAKWLLTDGTPPSRPYRMHASDFDDADGTPTSTSGMPGPLGLQLLHGGLERLGKIPPDDVPPPVLRTEPQPPPKLKKRRRSDFTHPDGTPLSYHYSKAFFNNDEQEYIIPSCPAPFPEQDQPEIRISVTKDWSRRKLLKHRDDQLLIYRVPCEHQIFFGMTANEYGLSGITLRRPEDEDDAIRVTRHGHISWDTGTQEEVWYVIARDPHVVRYVSSRVAQIKPSLYTKMKRMFWRNFGLRRSPAGAVHGILS